MSSPDLTTMDERNDEKIKAEIRTKIDANQEEIIMLQDECLKAAIDLDKRSLYTADCVENATVFNFMKY